MFGEMKGFILCRGLEAPAEENISVIGNPEGANFWLADNRLHKFYKDEVLYSEADRICFLDGYVSNKSELMDLAKPGSWDALVTDRMSSENLSDFRGSFCGIYADNERTRLVVDQVGNRALFYYTHNDVIIIANKLFFIFDLLKYHNINISVDEDAVKYMLSQAFMAGDTTFCKEIKRVEPGCFVDITGDGCKVMQYYMLDNTSIDYNMSEQAMVDRIDILFRQAIKREFDKDLEYGYTHLVDLSGGLDSRSVACVAHDMGYTNQVNITYSQMNSLDFKIAQKLSCDLKHRFFFMPLDDFRWILDIENNCRLLNGAALFSGSTGAFSMLNMIKGGNFGIEHTGIFGDAVLGSHSDGEENNYCTPRSGAEAYSNRLGYEVPVDVLSKYKNNELYWLETRAMRGMQSSCMLRQNFFETAAAFSDVDFMNFMMTVPHKYRDKHYIYIKWLEEKYGFCTEYPYEAWHGARPKNKNRMFVKKMHTLSYTIKRVWDRIRYNVDKEGMNPIDYWLKANSDISEQLTRYFEEHKTKMHGRISDSLINDVNLMFNEGDGSEKMQALTVCAMISMM